MASARSAPWTTTPLWRIPSHDAQLEADLESRTLGDGGSSCRIRDHGRVVAHMLERWGEGVSGFSQAASLKSGLPSSKEKKVEDRAVLDLAVDGLYRVVRCSKSWQLVPGGTGSRSRSRQSARGG